MPLPDGYYNLTDIQGLAPEQVRLHASGLYYTAPLSPGEHRVVYTYSLPLAQKVTTVLAERTIATAVLDVLVEDTRLVANSDLQFGGRVSIDPHTFWHFQGVGLGAHSRSWLQVTQWTEPATPLRIAAYSVIIGIALLGIGRPLYGAWRSRRLQDQPPSVTAEHLQVLKAARVRLLQAIARLDEQHATDNVADSVYHERRQAYKTQLLALAEQLQHMQGVKESHHS
jgi:hypothetical protein